MLSKDWHAHTDLTQTHRESHKASLLMREKKVQRGDEAQKRVTHTDRQTEINRPHETTAVVLLARSCDLVHRYRRAHSMHVSRLNHTERYACMWRVPPWVRTLVLCAPYRHTLPDVNEGAKKSGGRARTAVMGTAHDTAWTLHTSFHPLPSFGGPPLDVENDRRGVGRRERASW